MNRTIQNNIALATLGLLCVIAFVFGLSQS